MREKSFSGVGIGFLFVEFVITWTACWRMTERPISLVEATPRHMSEKHFFQDVRQSSEVRQRRGLKSAAISAVRRRSKSRSLRLVPMIRTVGRGHSRVVIWQESSRIEAHNARILMISSTWSNSPRTNATQTVIGIRASVGPCTKYVRTNVRTFCPRYSVPRAKYVPY